MKRLALLLLPLLLSSAPAIAADLDWQSYRRSETEVPPPRIAERDRVIEYDRYYEPPPVYAAPRVYAEVYEPGPYAYGYGHAYRPGRWHGWHDRFDHRWHHR